MKEFFTKMKNSFKHHWGQFINEGKQCVSELKNPKTRKKQIPNLLTSSRLLSPIFILPAMFSGSLLLTGIFVGIFAATDALDGYFARKYDAASEFGRKLDALTDKLFAGSLLIPLLFYNPILISTLAMEGVISVINVQSQLNNNNPKTEYVGKVKTAALFATLALNYISLAMHIPNAILTIALSSTLGLQAASATKYLITSIKSQKENNNMKYYEAPEINIIKDPEQAAQLVESLGIHHNIVQSKTELSEQEEVELLRMLRQQILDYDDSQHQDTSEFSDNPQKTLGAKIKK